MDVRKKTEIELSIVIPCYNEQENIEPLYQEIKKHCGDIRLEIVFVDDGSRDQTAKTILNLCARDPEIRLISFKVNAGHQAAIRAGLRSVTGNYTLTMDADMQHPPKLIPELYRECIKGFDVVYTIRTDAQKGILKNIYSKIFYRIFNALSNTSMVPNSSDFRILSRKAVQFVNNLPERKLVLRAVLPMLGFHSNVVYFKAGPRKNGRSAYTLTRSINLALDSFFNFTSFPLDIGLKAGFFISMAGFLYAGHAIYMKLFTDKVVPGYTDIITSVLILGGITLIYLGILGKYLAMVIDHLKNRPEYLLRDEAELKRLQSDFDDLSKQT